MKRLYLLVEGESHAAFLRRILPPEVLTEGELVVAGSDGRIPSLARTLLISRKRPIAVLMDSDSLNPNVIAERQDGTEELIRAAFSAVPVKVVSVVPEIETWFFAAPRKLEQLLGQSIAPEWIAQGKRDPKGVLQQFANKTNQTWDIFQAIRALDETDLESIRALPEVVELTTFLCEMLQETATA